MSALAAWALGAALAHDLPGEVVSDRHWDVSHLDLAVTIDPVARTVEGETVHTIRPLGTPSTSFRLHQVALLCVALVPAVGEQIGRLERQRIVACGEAEIA